ncbi:MAG: RDD family protein [Dermatophilaceae bacterium]
MPRPDPDAAPSAPPNASLLRRVGAVLVDWLLCQLVVIGLLGIDTGRGGVAAFAPLGVFALVNLVLVSTLGSTVGHRLFGLQVWQARSGRFPLQVLVRTGLLCLFIPAVLTGRDGRSLHDVAAGTRIVHVSAGRQITPDVRG